MPPEAERYFETSVETSEKLVCAHARLFKFGKTEPEESEMELSRSLKKLYVQQTRAVVSVFLLINNTRRDGYMGKLNIRSLASGYEKVTGGSNLDPREIVKGLSPISQEELRTTLKKMTDDIHVHCSQIAKNLGVEFKGEKPDIDKIMSVGQ